jgi:hypothetical protein
LREKWIPWQIRAGISLFVNKIYWPGAYGVFIGIDAAIWHLTWIAGTLFLVVSIAVWGGIGSNLPKWNAIQQVSQWQLHVLLAGTGIPAELVKSLTDEDMHAIAGSGGTVKDGVIEIQGDHCEKVQATLTEMGYRSNALEDNYSSQGRYSRNFGSECSTASRPAATNVRPSENWRSETRCNFGRMTTSASRILCIPMVAIARS